MVNAVKSKKPAAGGKKKNKHPLNAILGGGVMRYSKSKMYQRRSIYRLMGVKRPVVQKAKVPIMKIKKVGGPKNGGERTVFLKKPKANYPTTPRVRKRPARATFNSHTRYVRKSLKPGRIVILLAGRHQGKRAVLSNYPTTPRVRKRPARATFNSHTRYVRKSLKPGRIVILLAGRHQGKRAVLLKVLSSGLLLVSGPYGVNGCPLHRISQRYVIACQTRLNLSKMTVPQHINDKYFSRKEKKLKSKTGEGDIFAAKKTRFVPNEQRKADQKTVDAEILKVIKTSKDGKFIVKYLKNMFSFRATQYPHRMKF